MDSTNSSRTYSHTNLFTTAGRTGPADVPAPQSSSTSTLDDLDRWASGEENGAKAAEIIRAWLAKNDSSAVLNLSGLGLKSLPPLPHGLEKLMANKNQLTVIPEHHLPASLTAIDVHNNQLVALPETLPIASLRLLNAANNLLKSVSASAMVLDPACKIYLRANALDEATLLRLYGPELNSNGLRQPSAARLASAPQQAAAQGTGAPMQATALPTGVLPAAPDIGQGASTLPDVSGFTIFLNHVRHTVCCQNPAFRKQLAHLVTQMAADPVLDTKACSLAGELGPELKMATQQRYQLAYVFHKLQLFATDRDIASGRFEGRAADVVLHARRKFRADAVESRAAKFLWPAMQNKQDARNQLAGSVAAKMSRELDLGFDMTALNDPNESPEPDPFRTIMIANNVKNDEISDFASYLSAHDAYPGSLLKHADPQLATILSRTTDENGNQLAGTALTAMHLQDLKNYFAASGLPDATMPVWEWNANPDRFQSQFAPHGGGPSIPMTSNPVDNCKMQ